MSLNNRLKLIAAHLSKENGFNTKDEWKTVYKVLKHGYYSATDSQQAGMRAEWDEMGYRED